MRELTAGLICAPLSFPTADTAIDAPTQPNRKPVIACRSFTLGRIRSIGLPAPNMKMTRDRPPNSNTAVPTSSERNSRHGICQASSLFVMGRSVRRTDQELPSWISRRVRCVFQRTKSSAGGGASQSAAPYRFKRFQHRSCTASGSRVLNWSPRKGVVLNFAPASWRDPASAENGSKLSHSKGPKPSGSSD